MFRNFIQIPAFRRIIRFNFLQNTITAGSRLCRQIQTKPILNLVIASALPIGQNEIELFDAQLKIACKEGEKALDEFMYKIQDILERKLSEYDQCLKKQIEIAKKAATEGISPQHWDEQAEWRTKATELNQELTDLLVFFNALGNSLYTDAIQYFTQKEEDIAILKTKWNQINKTVKKQLNEIKKLETDLIITHKASILQTN